MVRCGSGGLVTLVVTDVGRRLLLGSTYRQCDLFVYYGSIKRELNKRLIFDSRCDGLNARDEGCTRLASSLWHMHWICLL